MTLNVSSMCPECLIERFESRKPFTWTRWGDYEWGMIIGGYQACWNKKKHRFVPTLQEDLRKILLGKPSYDLAIQRSSVNLCSEAIENWLEANELSDLSWHEADVFHDFSQDQLDRLLTVMSDYRTILVGPPRLKKLKPMMPWAKFVEIPPKNCYLAQQEIFQDLMSLIEYQKKPTFTCFSGSLVTGSVIDRLYRKLQGSAWLIDFGSFWENYLHSITGGAPHKNVRECDVCP